MRKQNELRKGCTQTKMPLSRCEEKRKLSEVLDALEVELLELTRLKRAGKFDVDGFEKNVSETLDGTCAQIRKLTGAQ
jgi:hypothetical protein